MDIHVFWEGPYALADTKKINDKTKDFGVYQVYGHHPLYGDNVLLYIGLAECQTFAARISQHKWVANRADAERTQVYVGRLAGQKKITKDGWNEAIVRAEKLLIYAHKPVLNTQSTKSITEDDVLNDRIFNWKFHRDLFPEVSGSRFTSKFDHITEDNIYDFTKTVD